MRLRTNLIYLRSLWEKKPSIILKSLLNHLFNWIWLLCATFHLWLSLAWVLEWIKCAICINLKFIMGFYLAHINPIEYSVDSSNLCIWFLLNSKVKFVGPAAYTLHFVNCKHHLYSLFQSWTKLNTFFHESMSKKISCHYKI